MYEKWKWMLFSHVWLFATPYSPWNSPGQNTGVGKPFPSPGDLPNPGMEPGSPELQADAIPVEPHRKPKNTGVGSLSLLRGIFPTQESNRGLLHCRRILYQLSYQGSPHICLLRCYQKRQYYKDRNFDFFQKGSFHERCKAFSVFAVELIKTLLKYLLLTFSFRGAWWASVHRITKSQTWLGKWAHTQLLALNIPQRKFILNNLITFFFCKMRRSSSKCLTLGTLVKLNTQDDVLKHSLKYFVCFMLYFHLNTLKIICLATYRLTLILLYLWYTTM